MDHFDYINGTLSAENVAVTDIVEQVGTPCYIYSRATLERHWQAFDSALGEHPHAILYAVKANSNLAVLNVMARLGSGFDIVSGGELARVLKAGGEPDKIVFSGVGKTHEEIGAALDAQIGCFNVESIAEIDRINQLADQKGCIAPIALRVNPDIDAQTHPYISTGLKENKFGIAFEEIIGAYQYANQCDSLKIVGIACHIGSQLIDISPYTDAVNRILDLVEQLSNLNINVSHIDLGGGLGIRYKDEEPPQPADWAKVIRDCFDQRQISTPIHVEPGRAIAGNAGLLVTRVEYIKSTVERRFAIVDAAMNDLIRPSLYDAWHGVVTVKEHQSAQVSEYEVVGPICESGDFLARSRELSIATDDLIAFRSAGAYGFVMSSNYNSRPRAAEVMVDGDEFYVVRHRESVNSLFAGENTLPQD